MSKQLKLIKALESYHGVKNTLDVEKVCIGVIHHIKS